MGSGRDGARAGVRGGERERATRLVRVLLITANDDASCKLTSFAGATDGVGAGADGWPCAGLARGGAFKACCSSNWALSRGAFASVACPAI